MFQTIALTLISCCCSFGGNTSEWDALNNDTTQAEKAKENADMLYGLMPGSSGYMAFTGQTASGRELTTFERGTETVFAALPAAGLLGNGGKAVAKGKGMPAVNTAKTVGKHVDEVAEGLGRVFVHAEPGKSMMMPAYKTNPSATARGKNHIKPDPNATGAHTVVRRNPQGNITGYVEYKLNPKNPTGFDEVKRVDTQYAKPHVDNGISTPHVHTKQPKGVRPPFLDELPS